MNPRELAGEVDLQREGRHVAQVRRQLAQQYVRLVVGQEPEPHRRCPIDPFPVARALAQD